MTGDTIDRHQNQSPNVEETNTDTRTNKQQDIVDIELTYGSDYNGSDVVGADQEGTADTENEVDPTLWFSNILPLLSRKVSL